MFNFRMFNFLLTLITRPGIGRNFFGLLETLWIVWKGAGRHWTDAKSTSGTEVFRFCAGRVYGRSDSSAAESFVGYAAGPKLGAGSEPPRSGTPFPVVTRSFADAPACAPEAVLFGPYLPLIGAAQGAGVATLRPARAAKT